MKYAYIENGTVVEILDGLPVVWRNISGLHHQEGNLEYLKEIGILPVEEVVPQYDFETQCLTGPTYDIQDDKVMSIYGVGGIDRIILENKTEMFMSKVRDARNSLLKDSDWAIAADIVELKGDTWYQAWKNYRQALRDFPATIEVDPNGPLPDYYTLQWPSKP